MDAGHASLPRRSTRQRVLRWTLGTIGAVVAALALFIVVLVNWDWNRAKPWVNDKVSEATGRTFSIDGDLSAEWHWPQPLEEGWRRWVPGVTVRAQQLS
ncbi:MAG: AsmA family protein, partial [Acidovorax sp.]